MLVLLLLVEAVVVVSREKTSPSPTPSLLGLGLGLDQTRTRTPQSRYLSGGACTRWANYYNLGLRRAKSVKPQVRVFTTHVGCSKRLTMKL